MKADKDKMKADVKSRCAERGFQRNVLELILYYCATPEECRLPTGKQLVLSELASAAMEYITGKETKGLSYGFNKDLHGSDFERTLFRRWQGAMSGSESQINELLQEAITGMIRPSWHSDQTGDGAYETRLYAIFNGWDGVCDRHVESTFSLCLEIIRRVEREIIPSLFEDIVKECEEIGKIMRKYINRDLGI